jgi:Domain of unknown function (DUF397)
MSGTAGIPAPSGRGGRQSNPSGSCAEAGQAGNRIAVRDTRQEHLGDARTVLRFSLSAWREFTSRLKDST